jgi:hypothetical protein
LKHPDIDADDERGRKSGIQQLQVNRTNSVSKKQEPTLNRTPRHGDH